MSIVLFIFINLLFIFAFFILINYILGSIVSRKFQKGVNETAIHFTGKSVKQLTNKQAHYSYNSAHAPNGENDFWAIYYDCRKCDLRIKGTIPKARFWSVTAYDKFARPLPDFIMDKTVTKEEGENYVIYLTTRPSGRPNEINVSKCPVGEAVVRVSLMEKQLDREKFTPMIREVNISN